MNRTFLSLALMEQWRLEFAGLSGWRLPGASRPGLCCRFTLEMWPGPGHSCSPVRLTIDLRTSLGLN